MIGARSFSPGRTPTVVGLRVALALTSMGLASPGCEEPAPPPSFPVTFRAESDPGVALAGVTITVEGAAPALTGADGTVRLELQGEEGTPVPVSATCPEGYRDAPALSPIVLRTTIGVGGAPAPGLRVGVQCLPAIRHGVVVVRAGGEGLATRAGLPVMIEGREVARTDASGVAHVSLDMAPGQSFQVLLATATASPQLRPQDPQLTFVFPDADEIFAFDENFDEEAPPAAPVRHHGRRRPTAPTTGPVMIPVRIPSTGR
ncbi:MAG: hypothetical protein U0234_27065 [Sandaracinus sp.]